MYCTLVVIASTFATSQHDVMVTLLENLAFHGTRTKHDQQVRDYDIYKYQEAYSAGQLGILPMSITRDNIS